MRIGILASWRRVHTKQTVLFSENFRESSHGSGAVMERRLPESYDFPTAGLERQVDNLVALPIASDFLRPVLHVRFRQTEGSRISMPEVAIYEYSQAQYLKQKIWAARQLAATTPTCNLERPQQLHKP
jgi:hypothetical protein